MLEEQLEAARSRCDQLHELEKENLLLRSGLQDLEMERETDRQKIEELLEENLCFEMELKKSLGESLQLSGRAETVSEELPHFEITQKPLSYEVHEVTTNQLLRLERENQELRQREEKLRLNNANTDTSTSVRILGLERENQQLQRTVERLQAQVDDESQNMQHVEGLSVDLLKEKERLERTLQTLQENRDREVEQLKFENEHLSQTVSSLRQRSQVSAEVRAKDIEQENRILHEAIMETSLKQSKMESERRQALEALEQCRARADKAEQLEQELGRLDRLNGQLQKQLLDLEVGRQRALLLEERASGLEAENGRLQKSSESLGMRLEALEMENAHLDQENLQLRKGMEMQAVDRAILSQLEVDNKELGKERDQLRKTVNQQKASIQRAEELQSAHQRLEAESQRLTRSLENARGRVSELEKEAEALEMEVQSKQRDLEEQRAAAGNLEQDRQALEQELEQAGKERRQLAKEYRRLQQQAEIREASLDEHNLKVARLVQENRQLLLEDKRTKETLNKLREVEVENGELLHQLALHRKEAGCLREELMTEKLKAQELSNELDNLSHKLERMGLEQGQPVLGEHSAQESNYKLLELKLESVFKETLRIRDTHIASLSCQLEEVGRRNQELSEQLRELKWNSEQTQPQEEVADKMAAPPRVAERPAEGKLERRESIRDPVSERLIEVERNNATLLAEKGALEGQLRQLKAQNDNLQAQILALQKQNNSLQALSAKLQVENGSLATQSASLAAQSSHLESKQATLEAQWAALAKEHQGLQDGHRALVRDHEKLAQLHESLEAEFEGLVEKHGALKGSYKSLEAEHKELEGRYSQLVARKVGLEELEAALRIRQEALEKDAGKWQDLSEAYQRLKDEHDRLNQSHADCGRQREELGAQHRALKTQLSTLQLEKARAEAESNVLKDHSQQLEIRWSKLSSQCELLNQLKGNLEEENRHLLHQIKSLTEENRVLLEKTVESKDQFHEEQRQYMDKLNELRREKQKLVEKIMDQYRVIDPAMPRRKGNWITDKMKKLIKPRKELSKDQLRPIFINTGGGLDDAEASVHLCQPDNSEQLQAPSKPSVGLDTLGRQSNSSVQDIPPVAEKVLVRTRRKLSSRIYSSETPRQKFRQRRVGWYATENEEEDEETDSSPSCSSTVSRDSDPTLDNKEVTGSLEPNKETGNKNTEPSIISDNTEGSKSKEEES
ncbi:girdin-like [Heterodontus francisci]|uniref:girdin-like n=1 Tax=Heterodontus francisci TaxID=7792 RepID=UPI00355C06D8